MTVRATGDLPHHLIEDVAICLGTAVAAELPPTCARYADRVVPMDDALVQCAIDMGGRPYYRGKLPSRMWTHFLRSFADAAKSTVHIRVLRAPWRSRSCRECCAEPIEPQGTQGTARPLRWEFPVVRSRARFHRRASVKRRTPNARMSGRPLRPLAVPLSPLWFNRFRYAKGCMTLDRTHAC
ncbi:MAG: hypothetical protein MUF21_14835 [Gemmatimonadaceae bacterium]|nr:hypothetical protein [Gemmatimonadaceae bacterium]